MSETEPMTLPIRCRLGLHDWYFGGLPPMWRKCRRCGVTR